MERSDHNHKAGKSHGWFHMLIGCGLMLIALLVLSSVGAGWGTALILLALLICPLAMIAMLGGSWSNWWRTIWGRQGHEKNP